MRKKVVILTGAGISAESGLATFRDTGGLWEGHAVEDVATPNAWIKNPSLVLEFYNQRRKASLHAEPNAAHKACVKLEEKYDVTVITQNVDNLHEKAGSTHIIHLHGELFKARSTEDDNLVYELEGWELNLGDLCEMGSQLRPHIVWFGEQVPMMNKATEAVSHADIFIIVGTSLQVYPAASLVDYVPRDATIFIVDPKLPEIPRSIKQSVVTIAEKAGIGMQKILDNLRGN